MEEKFERFFKKHFGIIEIAISLFVFGSLFLAKVIDNHVWTIFDDALSLIILLLLSWYAYKDNRFTSAKLLFILGLFTIFDIITEL